METNKEMTLLEFLQLIVRGIVWLFSIIWKGIVSCLKLFYRKWWVVLGMGLLALVAAAYYNRPGHRAYEVNARVNLYGADLYHVEETYRQIANAPTFPVSGLQTDLSELLNLPASETWILGWFSSYRVLTNPVGAKWVDFSNYAVGVDVDTTVVRVVKNELLLRFRTKHPDKAAMVGEAIVAYLNSNPVIQGEYRLYRQQLSEDLQRQTAQLVLLDSISRAFYKAQVNAAPALTRERQNILVGHQELTLMNEDIDKVYQRKAKIEKELALSTNPVVIANQFVVNILPVHHCYLFPIGIAIIGLILGMILACAIEHWKEWLQVLREK